MNTGDIREPHQGDTSGQQESEEPLLQDNERLQTSTGTQQSKWSLGNLTGIPAHLIGLLWIWCACAGLYSNYMWNRSIVEAIRSALQFVGLGIAVMLVILQIVWAYNVAILASNDRWQRPIRVRVPFLQGLMIFLDILLIISLLFCIVAVILEYDHDRWDQARLMFGCVLGLIAATHYTIILLARLSRGRIALHLTFERAASKSSSGARSAGEPYRDIEEGNSESRVAHAANEESVGETRIQTES